MGLTAETVDISRSRPRRACASETFLHLVESHPIRMRSLPALTEEYISAVDSKIEEIELPAESQGRYGPSRTLGLAPFFRGMFRTLVRPLTWEQLGQTTAPLLRCWRRPLMHDLNDATAAGLIQVERQGRSLFYSVDLGTTEDLLGYLALDVARARPLSAR